MSSRSQSVFISYTREDLAAARCIAEALSASGVEVWFDQADLEGGEAWDQKIRRQIKECSLFIPIVSAQTQSRREAYFRLEWKLAEERTHLMAEGTAFLLPIAIDETPEAAALVPESFCRTQWMRLPRGVPNTAFVDRVRALLEHQRSPDLSPVVPVRPRPARSRRKWPLVALVLVVAVGASLPFWRQHPAAPVPADVAPVAVEKSIAVLPFTNMSDDKENAYFADGVHEDILTNLANLSAIKVISRTSVMQFRDAKKPIGQIGRELGVAYVLEGSVRRAGNRIRVTGQLIKVATDEHVWARAYDRELADVFAVQAEIARDIAIALRAALSPGEDARLSRAPTTTLEAYEEFQRGMALVRTGVPKLELNEALPRFEHAVALDPHYAQAWAQIGWINFGAYWREGFSATRLAAVRDALARAEADDPGGFDVLNLGATMAALPGGDPAQVAHYQQRIIELYPNRSETNRVLCRIAIQDARWEDALAAAQQARALDPLNPAILGQLEHVLISIRHFDRAEEVERELVRLAPGDYDAAVKLATTPFLRSGSTCELKELLAKLSTQGAPDDAAARASRLEVIILLGDAAGMIRLWHESGENLLWREYSVRDARMLIAAAFISLGDRASAQPLLEKNRDEALDSLVKAPASVRSLNDLGLALAMLGDAEAGRAKLAQARVLIDRAPPAFQSFPRWQNTICRGWAGEKPAAVAGLRDILRSRAMARLGVNVHLLSASLLTLPLRDEPEFKAMLADPANNAPFF